jgi:CelD/BcsL family acetyltransferase involved in cellulose biosynthesis
VNAPVRFIGCDLAIVSNEAGFAALEDPWNDLFRRTARPQQLFQSHSFLRHWMRHYLEPGMQLCIVTARRGNRLVAVLPLVRQRCLGIDTLRFMGLPVAQFGDLLIEECMEAHLGALLWQAVKGLGADLLEARNLRDDAAFCRVISGESVLLDRQEAPFADLGQRVDAGGPGPAYSARERSNYRRRMRRLLERGRTSTRREPPGKAASVLATQAIAMKRHWLGRNAIYSPTVRDPRFTSFFRGIAEDPASDVRLHATALERNHRAIGIDLSFDWRGHCFGHVIATDPASEGEGLGQLLVHAVFAAAHERGNAAFELMAPADSYKMQHADGVVSVSSLAFPFTLRGRIFAHAVLRSAVPQGKHLIRALPSWARRMLLPL